MNGCFRMRRRCLWPLAWTCLPKGGSSVRKKTQVRREEEARKYKNNFRSAFFLLFRWPFVRVCAFAQHTGDREREGKE